MTNTELTQKLIAVTDKEWWQNVQETFNFNYSDFTTTLTGVSAIYEFVNQQSKGWEKYDKKAPQELLNSKTYFSNIKN